MNWHPQKKAVLRPICKRGKVEFMKNPLLALREGKDQDHAGVLNKAWHLGPALSEYTA